MESLTETQWDVTISGTGIAQSLLALALSRSGKKVLHVDKNPYYGGPEAALSLQEAEQWVSKVNKEPEHFPFEDAGIFTPSLSESSSGLSPSRAYTLSLSPQLIYSRSQLLPTLVSSKVYRQLEFQAVGSWWIYKPTTGRDKDLYRVPSSREDIFADEIISMKSKRTLMRFLRQLNQGHQSQGMADEEGSAAEDESLSKPLPEYLTSKFQVTPELYDPLLSLSLSQAPSSQTAARFAVPRIQRHLTSIGVFGPGFGSVLVKWGGGSEISQVGCRALAVGGGIYVLNSGIEMLAQDEQNIDSPGIHLKLASGETIKTRYAVGSSWDLPPSSRSLCDHDKVSRSITIVSSSLDGLFPITAEGGPIPAGAVVVFPASSLGLTDEYPPVYISVHSSETAECPTGQSVLYSSVSVYGPPGQSLIEAAIAKLLASSAGPDAAILWSLRYTQLGRAVGGDTRPANVVSGSLIQFPAPSLDLSFDDSTIDLVKDAWTLIMGEGVSPEDFMKFEDRENYDDDE
ncbi:GDP dissociation inhibitor-domain-containing protein [Aspergillus karnatakaensis]|uniref:putative Rab geranylgeranyl transferase escort protein n=1 Tax=Aspergillus karnatakaensis TaxID=1810916 RepID=UPI003CCDFDA5